MKPLNFHVQIQIDEKKVTNVIMLKNRRAAEYINSVIGQILKYGCYLPMKSLCNI